jgi:hypothetical protein
MRKKEKESVRETVHVREGEKESEKGTVIETVCK